jgi:transposase InsO family protein
VIKAGDLFSRRVVGWSMKAETAGLVTDALVMAIWRRAKPDALLHQSDQGSQYTSQKFAERQWRSLFDEPVGQCLGLRRWRASSLR